MEYSWEAEKIIEDGERERRTGVESYEQKLERWKDGWRRELEEDLERGD